MLEELKKFLEDLKKFKISISREKTATIGKSVLRKQAESLGTKWFSEFKDRLINDNGFEEDFLRKYSDSFNRLIYISAPNNKKKSYLDALNVIIKVFREDFIVNIQTKSSSSPSLGLLNKMLGSLSSPDEDEYLKEAVSCAQRQFFRAAVVLGWCAAVDRIHKTIESIGFESFNVTSAKMASQQKGRFKRFNSTQSVNSLSELREVLDTNVLWIVEGMGLIDINQHTRLKSCFDMRCHGAHPGEAPINEYNLLSFFSDINEIVFKNQQFKIPNVGDVL